MKKGLLNYIDNVNDCKYCSEQYDTDIMKSIEKLLSFWKKNKNKQMQYKFNGSELIIEGVENRKIHSVLDFGVSASTSSHNEKLLKSAIEQDVALIYLADDNLESHALIKFILEEKKNHVQIGLEKILSQDIEKMQHQTQGTLFVTPGISFNRYFELDDVKNKFLSILKILSMTRFSNPILFVLTYSLNNFTPKEIQKIHSKLKKIQDNGNIVLHVMNDYGEVWEHNESILGNHYSEYWIRNSGESIEMYPYFSKLYEHPMYKTLPIELKKDFVLKSSFLKDSHHYFKNGHVKKQGVVVFNKEKWFFEQNHCFLLKRDLQVSV